MEHADTTFIKKTYSSDEKQTLIEGWKQSGKSRMAFSKEHKATEKITLGSTTDEATSALMANTFINRCTISIEGSKCPFSILDKWVTCICSLSSNSFKKGF